MVRNEVPLTSDQAANPYSRPAQPFNGRIIFNALAAYHRASSEMAAKNTNPNGDSKQDSSEGKGRQVYVDGLPVGVRPNRQVFVDGDYM